MSRRNSLLVLAMLLATWTTMRAAKFHGFNRPGEEADLNMPHAPEVVTPFHTISITVNNATGTFPYARQLSLSIEKELTGAFSVVPSGSDGALTVSVLEFGQPASRTYDVMEYRAAAPNGNQTFIAIIPQKFPVTYWETQGMLTLKTVLKDKSGAGIDESILRAPFTMKAEIAVNHVATADRGALPTQDAILTDLILAGARSVRRRYAIGLEPVKVRLTVDNELLAGNRLAMEGDWEGALRAWDTVAMKSNAADREYNMALANYALAFKDYADSQSEDAATSHLTQAAQLLSSAERDDPKESYFKEIEGRLAAAKQEMDKGAQQAKALVVERERKADASAAAVELAAKGKAKGLDSSQPDTPQESEFRKYIRLQWKKRSQAPTDEDLAALKQTGHVAWKLNPEQAERVVNGEVEDWKSHQEKEALYLSNLKGFLSNNVLSADGRSELQKLSANLGLTAPEVAAIEAKVSFREEGKAVPSNTKSAQPKTNTHKATTGTGSAGTGDKSQ